MGKTKSRRVDASAAYADTIKELAKLVARSIREGGSKPSLDDHLTQIAEDLERLIAKELS